MRWLCCLSWGCLSCNYFNVKMGWLVLDLFFLQLVLLFLRKSLINLVWIWRPPTTDRWTTVTLLLSHARPLQRPSAWCQAWRSLLRASSLRPLADTESYSWTSQALVPEFVILIQETNMFWPESFSRGRCDSDYPPPNEPFHACIFLDLYLTFLDLYNRCIHRHSPFTIHQHLDKPTQKLLKKLCSLSERHCRISQRHCRVPLRMLQKGPRTQYEFHCCHNIVF